MKEVTNQTRRPQTLSDGTILAAAGTLGATKSVAAVSEGDEKRLVRSGAISVRDKPGALKPAQSPTSKVQRPEAPAAASAAAAVSAQPQAEGDSKK